MSKVFMFISWAAMYLGGLAIVYLIGAFLGLSFDLTDWNFFVRFLVLIIIAVWHWVFVKALGKSSDSDKQQ